MKIDETILDISPYDDENMILKRYALKKANTLPSFFRITETKEDQTITENIVDILKNITESNITDVFNYSPLYPRLTNKDIGILWVLTNGLPENINSLKRLSKLDFVSIDKIKESVKDFEKDVSTKRKEIQEEINKIDNITEILRTHEKIDIGSFFLESISEIFTIEMGKNISLFDVFDSIEVSSQIPYVVCKFYERIFIKTYKHIDIPEEWIYVFPFESDEDGIYIKVLNTELFLQQAKINNIYSNCVWKDTSVVLNFPVSSPTSKQLVENRIWDNVKVEKKILQSQQISVKGHFILPIPLSKTILTDLIFTDSVISSFLFIVERKNVITFKRKFILYYSTDSVPDTKKAIHVSIRSEHKNIVININKAINLHQIYIFQEIFSYILGRYKSKFKEVVKVYEKFIPNFKADISTIKGKKIKKTGKRSDTLREKRPELFITRYPDRCQQSRQPYLVESPAKKDTVVENLPKFFNEGEKENVYIEFPRDSKDYYFCAPREEQDKSKDHLWAGLIYNKLENKNEYPYLPCCFLENQYTKKGSVLKVYLSGKKKKEKILQPEEQKKAYILSYMKPASENRYGEIHPCLVEMFWKLNIQKIQRGSSLEYPLVRYGVKRSNASFVYCLETAFNNDFLKLNDEDKDKDIRRVLENISNSDFSIAKQELFGLDDDKTRKYLLDTNSYVDPTMFISLFERYYRCNILLLEINEGKINILLPRFSQIHLFKKINKEKENVVIFVNTTDATNKQCEILYNFSSSTFFSQDVFDLVLTATYDSHKTYMLMNNLSIEISPYDMDDKIFDGLTHQYIDPEGKTRGLWYDNVLVFVSPLPNFDLPIKVFERNYTNSKDNVTKFIQYHKIKITKQTLDITNTKCIGIWFELLNTEAFIVVNFNKLNKIQISTEINPLQTLSKSTLTEFDSNKMVANILMQYSLYIYSSSPETFSEDSFIVRKNFKYKTSQLQKNFDMNDSNFFDENQKLIVLNENVVKKLMEYVQIEIFNNEEKIKNYRFNRWIQDYFSDINNFKHTPTQYVFSSREEYILFRSEFSLVRKNSVYVSHSETEESYLYKNYYIDKTNFLIMKNVKNGDINKALYVCWKWDTEKIVTNNIPELEKNFYEQFSYAIYDKMGKKKVFGEQKDKVYMLFHISKDKYASLIVL